MQIINDINSACFMEGSDQPPGGRSEEEKNLNLAMLRILRRKQKDVACVSLREQLP